jgi:hypothetical protein
LSVCGEGEDLFDISQLIEKMSKQEKAIAKPILNRLEFNLPNASPFSDSCLLLFSLKFLSGRFFLLNWSSPSIYVWLCILNMLSSTGRGSYCQHRETALSP